MQGLLTFRPANESDLVRIEALLSAAKLPLDGVREHLPGFLLALQDSDLIGAAAVEVHGEHGLLRSVVVREDQRGTGLGVTLTEQLIRQARQKGLGSLVLLTTTAENFFPKFGFVRIDRAALPQDVRASRELQGACPVSAVVMQLDLKGVHA